MRLATKILAQLIQHDGLSDRQLSEAIYETPHRSTQINSECRHLENRGYISRQKDNDKPIRNFLIRLKPQPQLRIVSPQH